MLLAFKEPHLLLALAHSHTVTEEHATGTILETGDTVPLYLMPQELVLFIRILKQRSQCLLTL